ncbi:lysozyme inhibitor LprI family protein [Tolumonas lignilytica]|jgi:Uncharacterized protein conserved in bacteria, putative lipoprotein|uniref:lysozyme inhibitor LprI family protein n=1 Tax=Tolumonas lignilytica TaxID=1283284 RepID=UPI0004679D48|nr:hypothetical protein [Tolumonas lignilytica]
MNAWKFWLAVTLFSGIQTVAMAATDSAIPAKPSAVTPEMMAKYAITEQTFKKKPNCNEVKDPLLDAFCERPILTKLDGEIRQLMKDLPAKQADYPQYDLQKGQQAWLDRHDNCMKNKDLKMCLELSYMERLSELQAQFELVPKEGPIHYQCGADKRDAWLTFYATTLPAVIVKYNGQYRDAFMGPLSRGVKYNSHNLTVVEGKHIATLYWDDAKLDCQQLAN